MFATGIICIILGILILVGLIIYLLMTYKTDNKKQTFGITPIKTFTLTKVKFTRKTYIFIAFCLSIILILATIFSVGYLRADERAEKVVAVYLSNNAITKSNLVFLSFEKTYSFVTLKGISCTVNISGTANVKNKNYIKDFDEQFSARVTINCLTGDSIINSVTLGNNVIF